MKKSIERKVSEAVLQTPQEVIIGGDTYFVAPPSVATLVMVSEAVSDLPMIKLTGDNVLSEVLSMARDCGALGDIVSVLILGAKRIREDMNAPKNWITRIRSYFTAETESEQARLSRLVLEEMSPRELNDLVVKLLKGMQIADFFGLTTSLIGVNLLRQTREVVTTVSGL